jgi:hypothetical protein
MSMEQRGLHASSAGNRPRGFHSSNPSVRHPLRTVVLLVYISISHFAAKIYPKHLRCFSRAQQMQ